MDYLNEVLAQTELPNELRSNLERMRTQFQKRLWHQLTLTVQNFFQLPGSQGFQVDLYLSFISTFANHLNQIKLVHIAAAAAQQLQDPSAALAFLQPVIQAVDTPETREAYVLATMEAAQYQLLLGQVDETQQAVAKCKTSLDQMDNVKSTVHATFYRVSADYHKAKAEYSDFYATSLLYLACIDVDQDLSAAQRLERAHDLALAALLGQTTYNFGELLLHPVLTALVSTQHEWIRLLLFAFNQGSIGKFDALLPRFHAEPLLQDNYAFLRQKICLMALIESIFSRPAGQRVVAFDAIAVDTALPEHEVEHLLMKSMSLGLIKGHIDQVHRLALVTWVQPRVLDPTQIVKLDKQLQRWSQQVKRTGDFAFMQAPELFAAA